MIWGSSKVMRTFCGILTTTLLSFMRLYAFKFLYSQGLGDENKKDWSSSMPNTFDISQKWKM